MNHSSGAMIIAKAMVRARDEGRFCCIECDDRGPHDDNGEIGEERCWCCRNCGLHHDVEMVENSVRNAVDR